MLKSECIKVDVIEYKSKVVNYKQSTNGMYKH